ncbi:MAG: hypothetical protein CM1200mP29_07330 [Verrucomicrobiota bacterium]|nr:MAG: hypothetical protein CM1200mP29_07330 [Verrucomicrobiota bacterium]
MEHWKDLSSCSTGPSEKPGNGCLAQPFIDLDNLFDYVIAEVFLETATGH